VCSVIDRNKYRLACVHVNVIRDSIGEVSN
jgi:hypothetical protein